MSPWPDGAPAALVVTVGLESETLAGAGWGDGRCHDKAISGIRYGAERGVDRLLGAFADALCLASWFLPEVPPPYAWRDVAAAGHEVAWWAGDPDRAVTEVPTAEKIAEVGARGVTGYRGPIGHDTATQLVAAGFTWSSSWRGDDLPYVHPGTTLVEVPTRYELDDRVHWEFTLDPPQPPASPRITSDAVVTDIWLRELDAACDEGLLTTLVLHPELAGTPGHAALVREVLGHARARGCWVGTGSALARHQGSRANDPAHPAEVYVRYRDA